MISSTPQLEDDSSSAVPPTQDACRKRSKLRSITECLGKSGEFTSNRCLQARIQSLRQLDLSFISNPQFHHGDADAEILSESISLDVPPELVFDSAGKLPSHVAMLCMAPLLAPQEEQRLFRRMNYLLYRASECLEKIEGTSTPPSEDQISRTEAYVSEARAIKNRIVSGNIRLAVSIVKKLSSGTDAFEEMLSDGLMALIRAVDKFDFDRGFRFSTYATMVIRRQIYRVMKYEHRDRNRFPNADHAVLAEQTADQLEPRIGFQGWQRLDKSLTEMLQSLDTREQTIIRARFGFDTDGKKQTLQSLADDFGVCKERVRQLEKRAMGKLRRLADANGLESFVEPELAIE